MSPSALPNMPVTMQGSSNPQLLVERQPDEGR